MLDQVLITLNKLANIANSEATKFSKSEDKANKDKSQALYTKQSQITALITNLKQFPDFLHEFEAIGAAEASDLANAYVALSQLVDDKLAPFAGHDHASPELRLAVYHPAIMQLINDANTALLGLKRNAELKKMSIESLQKEEALAKQGTAEEQAQKQIAFDAKMKAYGDMCEEDAKLEQLIAANNFAAIAESNRKWAQFLKEKFQKNDLPELPKAAPAGKTSAAAQWGKGFFGAITDMFKALNDPTNTDKNGSIMKVLGTLIQLIFNAVGSLFKKFLGNGKEAQAQVDDFTTNASQFFTNMLGSGMATACQPGQSCAKGAKATPAATFTPGFTSAKASAPSLHQPATPEQQPSMWSGVKHAASYLNPFSYF